MPRGIVHRPDCRRFRPDCRRLVRVRELTHAHTRAHTHVHTRAHTHTHTCTHTYTHKQPGIIEGEPGCAWQLRTQELRTQQCSQGSSWVSGLLVGVRAPRRCPQSDGSVVKGRQCKCASAHASTCAMLVSGNTLRQLRLALYSSGRARTFRLPLLDNIAHQAPPPLLHPL